MVQWKLKWYKIVTVRKNMIKMIWFVINDT